EAHLVERAWEESDVRDGIRVKDEYRIGKYRVKHSPICAEIPLVPRMIRDFGEVLPRPDRARVRLRRVRHDPIVKEARERSLMERADVITLEEGIHRELPVRAPDARAPPEDHV